MMHPEYWERRYHAQGRNYVANATLDNYSEQKVFIERVIGPYLPPADVVLDFGAGVGRFQSMLSFAKELHAIDVVEGAINELKQEFPKTHAVAHTGFPLPYKNHTFDLVWSCMVLQHLMNDDFWTACSELHRITKPNGRIVLIENACDKASHVELRLARTYLLSLKFKSYKVQWVSIDKPNSHWFIIGKV